MKLRFSQEIPYAKSFISFPVRAFGLISPKLSMLDAHCKLVKGETLHAHPIPERVKYSLVTWSKGFIIFLFSEDYMQRLCSEK